MPMDLSHACPLSTPKEITYKFFSAIFLVFCHFSREEGKIV
jgi:hypothetical protein